MRSRKTSVHLLSKLTHCKRRAGKSESSVLFSQTSNHLCVIACSVRAFVTWFESNSQCLFAIQERFIHFLRSPASTSPARATAAPTMSVVKSSYQIKFQITSYLITSHHITSHPAAHVAEGCGAAWTRHAEGGRPWCVHSPSHHIHRHASPLQWLRTVTTASRHRLSLPRQVCVHSCVRG